MVFEGLRGFAAGNALITATLQLRDNLSVRHGGGRASLHDNLGDDLVAKALFEDE